MKELKAAKQELLNILGYCIKNSTCTIFSNEDLVNQATLLRAKITDPVLPSNTDTTEKLIEMVAIHTNETKLNANLVKKLRDWTIGILDPEDKARRMLTAYKDLQPKPMEIKAPQSPTCMNQIGFFLRKAAEQIKHVVLDGDYVVSEDSARNAAYNQLIREITSRRNFSASMVNQNA